MRNRGFRGHGSHHLPPISNSRMKVGFSTSGFVSSGGWGSRKKASPFGVKQPYSSSSDRFSRFTTRDEVPRYVSPESSKRKVPKNITPNGGSKRRGKRNKARFGSRVERKSKSLPNNHLRKTYPVPKKRKKKRRSKRSRRTDGETLPHYPSPVESPPPSFSLAHPIDEDEFGMAQSFPDDVLRKGIMSVNGVSKNQSNSSPNSPTSSKKKKRKGKSSSNKPKKIESHPCETKIYEESELYKDLHFCSDTYYSFELRKQIDQIVEKGEKGEQSGDNTFSVKKGNERKKRRKTRRRRSESDYLL